MTDTTMTRRTFLRVFGATGASLVVGIYLGGCDEAVEPATTTTGATMPPTTTTTLPGGILEPNIYLKIEPAGTVTVTAFRSEMGQGVRTAIAMILAEELDADWDKVVLEQAPADSRFGDQITGGSRSISENYLTLRLAGASTRWMLIEAAARRWEVAHGDCTTEPGVVVHPDGETKLAYGALAGLASEVDVPSAGRIALKSEAEFRIIGSQIPQVDGPHIVTGDAIFGSDVRLPDMVFATIERCPNFDGRVVAFDSTGALAIEGVLEVFELDGAVVVAASSTWAALQGRRALIVEWDTGSRPDLTSDVIWAELHGKQNKKAESGEIDATYRIPYQAHATMEPMNCVADVREDRAEIWAPTQNPQRIQLEAAHLLGMTVDAVTVQMPLIGGGFGRRLQPDYALEAARVSQAIGRPVQVMWTREDDIRHDFYHRLSYQYLRGVPDVSTEPTIRNIKPDDYVPTGAWRSVADHRKAFALQSFIDEMADALDMDPLEFRRQRYNGRALEVIELAAEKAGWGDPLPDRWGRGIAHNALFEITDVAMVAEVEVDGAAVKVHRVVAAVHCGQVVNPANVEAQIEGAIAFGLTAVLKGGVTIEKGGIKEGNFHDSPILTMDEMPQVEVHLIESNEPPLGIGEAGVPPVAPAVTNAVFAATGNRLRTLPVDLESL